MHSTKVAIEHRIEMNGWLVGHDIEMCRTKEVVWTSKDEQRDPKKVWRGLGWGYSMPKMSRASLVGMV